MAMSDGLVSRSLKDVLCLVGDRFMSSDSSAVSLCSDYLFKLLLIGDSGVGKSCLLLRFAVSPFVSICGSHRNHRCLRTWILELVAPTSI